MKTKVKVELDSDLLPSLGRLLIAVFIIGAVGNFLLWAIGWEHIPIKMIFEMAGKLLQILGWIVGVLASLFAIFIIVALLWDVGRAIKDSFKIVKEPQDKN